MNSLQTKARLFLIFKLNFAVLCGTERCGAPVVCVFFLICAWPKARTMSNSVTHSSSVTLKPIEPKQEECYSNAIITAGNSIHEWNVAWMAKIAWIEKYAQLAIRVLIFHFHSVQFSNATERLIPILLIGYKKSPGEFVFQRFNCRERKALMTICSSFESKMGLFRSADFNMRETGLCTEICAHWQVNCS